MSATIGKNDIKLSVFGRGFEDERTDSGTGESAPDEILNFPIYHACFDNTGAYCWLVTDEGLRKYETENWTDVGQSIVSDGLVLLLHPSNVANNYGLAVVDSSEIVLFDLTSDTVHQTASGTYTELVRNLVYDCILTGDQIKIIALAKVNTNNPIITIDKNDLNLLTVATGGVAPDGFINDSLIYATYSREWFFQASVAYGLKLDGSVDWQTDGINRNDDVAGFGFGTNGRLILPVKVYGAWRFGIFDGTTAPVLVPPKPAKTFGRFKTAPDPWYQYGYPWGLAYADGRDELCVMTSEGLLYTDLNEVIKLETEFRKPLSMRNGKVICTDYTNSRGYIYGY